MLSNLQKAKLRSFTLLLEQPNNLSELRAIDNDWIESIINHYTYTKPYANMYDMPFYHKGYVSLLMKMVRRELFGSLKDIYSTVIPNITKPLTYPLFYSPIELPSKYRILKLDKINIPKLRNDFDKVLQGFNADIIYVVDVENDYYIIDYEFKQSLICYSLKFEYIDRFNKSRGLNRLSGYVVLKEVQDMRGFIWMRDEEGKFVDRYVIKWGND